MINVTEQESKVVSGLSAILALTRAAMESERHHPSRSGDQMDDYINERKSRIETLKRLRDEFEAEMAKPI